MLSLVTLEYRHVAILIGLLVLASWEKTRAAEPLYVLSNGVVTLAAGDPAPPGRTFAVLPSVSGNCYVDPVTGQTVCPRAAVPAVVFAAPGAIASPTDSPCPCGTACACTTTANCGAATCPAVNLPRRMAADPGSFEMFVTAPGVLGRAVGKVRGFLHRFRSRATGGCR